MADLVVSIDGDSKGLVGSLQKADGAMSDMRDEAKKLSDQLREVADDADKAAGELITKLGGPGAIKAIAGVGIAFGAVKTGVETFIDSSERMFAASTARSQRSRLAVAISQTRQRACKRWARE